MAGVVVGALMGVVKPLLEKLTRTVVHEFNKLTEVRKNVQFLQEELSTMAAFLDELALREDDDELSPQTEECRNQFREMAYDIEDSIDDFVDLLDDPGTGADDQEWWFHKIVDYLKVLREHRKIANKIQELKDQVDEANHRRKRYKFDDFSKTTTSDDFVPIDPRITAMYKEVKGLVGIDVPMEELYQLLTENCEMQQEQLKKVVSIVGFGGLGKTTLAKLVYDRINERHSFHCKAFVSVSQKPNITRLLNSIQQQLQIKHSSQACEPQDTINSIRSHLENKRYIIVVDDLWTRAAWDTISCAFPENSTSSIVIVTTRVEDVALFACSNHQFIYKMRPLSEKDARKLFYRRIFGSEYSCPSQYKEVSAEILKKCAGLPLAVITISSILACRPRRIMQEWESIRNSFGSVSGTNQTLEGMRQILNLSYKNLPPYLRICLLYLGNYPEDHLILKGDVVRQWVAEGFVSDSHGPDKEDVAKSYFNELVNRGLIQPEFTNEGEVINCRMHDMMLDLILVKCKKQNFLRVAYSHEDYMASTCKQHGYSRKVRRLSLQSNTEEPDCTIAECAESVRSITFFGRKNASRFAIPLLLPSKYLRLRVLYIESDVRGSPLDLTVIKEMRRLRYLKVCLHGYTSSSDTDTDQVVQLPSTICGLVHLETIEMSVIKPVILPSDIVGLPRLRNLSVPKGSRLSDGRVLLLRNKSLRTLGQIRAVDVDMEALGEMSNLRELTLCFDEAAVTGKKNIGALGPSIEKLSNLTHFEIDSCCYRTIDDNNRLGSLSTFPQGIEQLSFQWWLFSRVPRWLNATLCSLHTLYLEVSKTSTDEVGVLGELPSLSYLELTVQSECRAPIVFGTSRGSFAALEFLYFSLQDAAPPLGFQVGVMPKLWELSLHLTMSPLQSGIGTTPAGLWHLSSLQKIDVTIFIGEEFETEEIDVTERAFRDAAQAHPNRPSFKFDWAA